MPSLKPASNFSVSPNFKFALSGESYEGVTCLACRQVHMVNPRTGKVLGADEK
jgi:hypothetical protein